MFLLHEEHRQLWTVTNSDGDIVLISKTQEAVVNFLKKEDATMFTVIHEYYKPIGIVKRADKFLEFLKKMEDDK